MISALDEPKQATDAFLGIAALFDNMTLIGPSHSDNHIRPAIYGDWWGAEDLCNRPTNMANDHINRQPGTQRLES